MFNRVISDLMANTLRDSCCRVMDNTAEPFQLPINHRAPSKYGNLYNRITTYGWIDATSSGSAEEEGGRKPRLMQFIERVKLAQT